MEGKSSYSTVIAGISFLFTNITICKWLYIIVGSVNFLFALVAFTLLPDFPESSTGSQKWLLTDRERQVALERIRSDSVAQESNRSVWWGLRRAVTDYRTWVFVRAPFPRFMILVIARKIHDPARQHQLSCMIIGGRRLASKWRTAGLLLTDRFSCSSPIMQHTASTTFIRPL